MAPEGKLNISVYFFDMVVEVVVQSTVECDLAYKIEPVRSTVCEEPKALKINNYSREMSIIYIKVYSHCRM